MDDNKTGVLEADTAVESPSEPGSPEKCTESEGSSCEAQLNSPPLNNEGEKETKNPKKAFVRVLSLSRVIPRSIKEIPTKEPEILRSSKRFAKKSFKQIEDHACASKGHSSVLEESGEFKDDSIEKEPPSEHQKGPSGSPEKRTESEDSYCETQLNSPPLNHQGGKETTSPNKPLATMLSFSREISKSVKGISVNEPGILRSSKRFANRSLKWIEGHVHAHKESRSTSEDIGKPEDKCVKKEPLSVMEINEFIQTRQLLEAFENIKGLEMELLAERDAKKYGDNLKECTAKAKDVDLLYDHISKVIRQIVQETLDLPGIDEKALTSLMTLIEEEEKAHPKASEATISSGPAAVGSARNWRQLWKEAVNQSAKGRVCKVPVPLKDNNQSWLSQHLAFFTMAVKEDLFKVKLHVQKCYPQDYNVCDTYVGAFHKALSVHLHDILEENSLTLTECYALLSWINNIYRSEEFLGHVDLKPEIKTEDLPSLLTPEALAKLKNDYINSVKEKTKECLDNILVLQTGNWDSEGQPEALRNQPCSSLSLDIQMMVGQHMKASGRICDRLEVAVLDVSLKEVMEFVPRFEKTFLEWDKENDDPQFVELMVTYINDFEELLLIIWSSRGRKAAAIILGKSMVTSGLRAGERNFSISCQELEETVKDLMLNYQKHFLHKLRQKTQPMLKKILSKQWVLYSGTPDALIQKAVSATEEFSKPLIHLKEPIHKDFLHEIHKYMVKEYITQTLKSKSKTGRRKWEEASKLMKQDALIIHNSMKHLGSSSDWLFPAILHIADIIGEKKKRNIKDCLKKLSQDYPDIRREHILALLTLRGWWRNTRQSMADQIDGLSEGSEAGSRQTLFAEIELPNTIQCF
ncbi:PREDICTED: exocyst complex component 3-like protein 4 [Gekko japonicus]|uniref:Exocyst complex component 3-like protein 4 n=1 Tax=Gekko japonicus TaxID=146911 RepID=A0ABM1KMY7_GEKJA|nr:PREDICTED: exocyst complex component 3-like protein 4 [Gekko japonicus]